MPKMKRILIRDDDTNATTPVTCLERLYRPFLDRRMPVNLSVIPEVRTDIIMPNGKLEGFIAPDAIGRHEALCMRADLPVTQYLRENPLYHVAQHGLRHEFVNGHFEFDREDRNEIAARLENGGRILREAGFPAPIAFVAPQDKMSRISLQEVVCRFSVVSCGWYERRRLPLKWLPRYAMKKLLGQAHWRIGQTLLLTHPGGLMSRYRPYDGMLAAVRNAIETFDTLVLVTHWWEFFPNGEADDALIDILHQVGDMLAARDDVSVVTFRDLVGTTA